MNRLELDARDRGSVVAFIRAVADGIYPHLPEPQRHYSAWLKELSVYLATPRSAGGCEKCGGPKPPVAATGRPRKYCTTCSPRKTRGKVQA